MYPLSWIYSQNDELQTPQMLLLLLGVVLVESANLLHVLVEDTLMFLGAKQRWQMEKVRMNCMVLDLN